MSEIAVAAPEIQTPPERKRGFFRMVAELVRRILRRKKDRSPQIAVKKENPITIPADIEDEKNPRAILEKLAAMGSGENKSWSRSRSRIAPGVGAKVADPGTEQTMHQLVQSVNEANSKQIGDEIDRPEAEVSPGLPESVLPSIQQPEILQENTDAHS